MTANFFSTSSSGRVFSGKEVAIVATFISGCFIQGTKIEGDEETFVDEKIKDVTRGYIDFLNVKWNGTGANLSSFT